MDSMMLRPQQEALLVRQQRQVRDSSRKDPALELAAAEYIAVQVIPTLGDRHFSPYMKYSPSGHSSSYMIESRSLLVGVLYRIYNPTLRPAVRPIFAVYRARFRTSPEFPEGQLVIGGPGGCLLSPRDIWLSLETAQNNHKALSIADPREAGFVEAALDMDLVTKLCAEDRYETTTNLPGPQTLFGFPLEYRIEPDLMPTYEEAMVAAFQPDGLARFRPGLKGLDVLQSPDGTITDIYEQDGFKTITFDLGLQRQWRVSLPAWVELLPRATRTTYIPSPVPFAQLPTRQYRDIHELRANLDNRSFSWLQESILGTVMRREDVVVKEPMGRREYRWRGMRLNVVPAPFVLPGHFPKGRVFLDMGKWIGLGLEVKDVRPFHEDDQYKGHIFALHAHGPCPTGEQLQWTDPQGRWVIDLSSVGHNGQWLSRVRDGKESADATASTEDASGDRQTQPAADDC
jgi:hypothetical protein